MSEVIPCPIPGFDEEDEEGVAVYYVAIPDLWLGEHSIVYDEAVDAATEQGLGGLFRTFAVSLALTEDYNLPGLTGKPENWDFSKLALEVIAWVNVMVHEDFMACFAVKEKYYNPLLTALREQMAVDGSSETAG